MDLPRSSFYSTGSNPDADPIVAEIIAIAESSRGYGYRRITAALRHRGLVVNSKKVRRIMREHDLSPKHK